MNEDLRVVGSPPRLPPRDRGAHKGDFGKVLVVGGSLGMSGAVALAANAALRGGAGLVTFAAPRTAQCVIAGLCPCATSLALPETPDGQLAVEALPELQGAFGRADALAVGPGLARGPGQRSAILAALDQNKPLVLDADGLNNLAQIDDWPALRRCPLVMTPHPGELARLTGLSVEDIQANRQAVAVKHAKQWRGGPDAAPLVLVLKGAGTIVTDGRQIFVNDTGNPGMATGGTGDVLTGLIAALLGQGLSPFDAACLGVWVHGRSGDLAAAELGEPSLIATDLLDFLPMAIQERIG